MAEHALLFLRSLLKPNRIFYSPTFLVRFDRPSRGPLPTATISHQNSANGTDSRTHPKTLLALQIHSVGGKPPNNVFTALAPAPRLLQEAPRATALLYIDLNHIMSLLLSTVSQLCLNFSFASASYLISSASSLSTLSSLYPSLSSTSYSSKPFILLLFLVFSLESLLLLIIKKQPQPTMPSLYTFRISPLPPSTTPTTLTSLLTPHLLPSDPPLELLNISLVPTLIIPSLKTALFSLTPSTIPSFLLPLIRNGPTSQSSITLPNGVEINTHFRGLTQMYPIQEGMEILVE